MLNYLFICAGFNLLLCAGVIYPRSTDLGVFLSHLTTQLLKTDGMVFSVHDGNFQCYFMRPKSLRACLEQRFFIGKIKETKTEERKTRRLFGTKETSGPFPPEACSNNTVSQEKKHMLLPLVSFSFALARGKSNEKRESGS